MAPRCCGNCGPVIVQPPEGGAGTVACDEGQALLVSVCDSDESPPEPEECVRTSTLLLCDLPDDSGGTGGQTVTDATGDAGPYTPSGGGTEPLAAGTAAVLWAGGALTIPPDAGPGPGHSQSHQRLFAATVQADRPSCDTGIATVTASIHVERTGPDPAFAVVGSWNMWLAGSHVARASAVRDAPVGYSDVLTVSATVPAAVLAAGDVVLVGYLETYHGSDHVGGWEVDDFTLDVAFDQAGCSTAIYAHVTTECDDGTVLAVTYTDLDGNPYVPQGTVGQCRTVIESLPPEMPGTTGGCQYISTLEVCRCDDVNGDGTEIVQYNELWGVPCNGSPPELLFTFAEYDPGTEYEPTNPVECDDAGESS